MFVFCLRAQLGICREAVCVPTCPLQAGRQVGRWVLGPPCGAGLHRLSGHRDDGVLTWNTLVLSLCQSLPSSSVWCAQGRASAHTLHTPLLEQPPCPDSVPLPSLAHGVTGCHPIIMFLCLCRSS